MQMKYSERVIKMELWIRSQDERILQKVDNVYLNANYDNRRICSNDSRDYESDLGEYKTKERALEVLDEIQKYILLPNTDNSAYVYEMPEE